MELALVTDKMHVAMNATFDRAIAVTTQRSYGPTRSVSRNYLLG